jgi:hypothetical protein
MGFLRSGRCHDCRMWVNRRESVGRPVRRLGAANARGWRARACPLRTAPRWVRSAMFRHLLQLVPAIRTSVRGKLQSHNLASEKLGAVQRRLRRRLRADRKSGPNSSRSCHKEGGPPLGDKGALAKIESTSNSARLCRFPLHVRPAPLEPSDSIAQRAHCRPSASSSSATRCAKSSTSTFTAASSRAEAARMRFPVRSFPERGPECFDRLPSDRTQSSVRLGQELATCIGVGRAEIRIVEPATQDPFSNPGARGGCVKRPLDEQCLHGPASAIIQFVGHFRSPPVTDHSPSETAFQLRRYLGANLGPYHPNLDDPSSPPPRANAATYVIVGSCWSPWCAPGGCS